MKKLENVTKKLKEILDITPMNNRDNQLMVDDITCEYDKVLEYKDEYACFIKKEVEERELTKQEMFKEAKLNIKLPKFTGYDSILDVYTFQSEFEKLYKRTTPIRMLADLLKNNYLEGAALSLVKNEDNIDEIWSRLKLLHMVILTNQEVG